MNSNYRGRTALLTAFILFNIFCVKGQAFKTFIPYYQKGLWGYCDTAKKITIQPQFKQRPGFFNEYGFAIIKTESGFKYGYSGLIDSSGTAILPIMFSEFYYTPDKLIFARNYSSNDFRIYNFTGKKIMKREFENYTESSDYYFLMNHDTFSLYSYIEASEEMVLIKHFKGYSWGNWLVKNGKTTGFTFYTRKHKTNTASDINTIETFDLKGRLIKSVKYQKVVAESAFGNYDDMCVPNFDFEKHMNNTSLSRRNNKMGMVNPVTKDSLPYIYDDIQFCLSSETYFRVKMGNYWGVVNNKNETIAEIKYDDIYFDEINSDHANMEKKEMHWIAKSNDKFGLLNTVPAYRIPCIYESIIHDDHCYRVESNKKWGILNDRGDTVIGFIFDQIESHNLNNFRGKVYFAGKIADKWGLFGTNKWSTGFIYDNLMYDGNNSVLGRYVCVSNEKKGLLIIDYGNGELTVIEPKYKSITWYERKTIGSRKLFEVITVNGLYAYMDDTGMEFFEE